VAQQASSSSKHYDSMALSAAKKDGRVLVMMYAI
jgi:hypothetical protein